MQFSTKFSLYNLTTNEYKFSFSTLNLYGLPYRFQEAYSL